MTFKIVKYFWKAIHMMTKTLPKSNLLVKNIWKLWQTLDKKWIKIRAIKTKKKLTLIRKK